MARQTLKKKKAQCQCDISCKGTPLPGSAFCKKHFKRCPIKSPLSGYEPDFNPDKYNRTRKMRESHNCFAYAFDHVEKPGDSECNEEECNVAFHQPGRKSGFPKWSEARGKRCPDIFARLRADAGKISSSSFTHKCPTGTSKIALVVAPDLCGNEETKTAPCKSSKTGDYHFYRQDSNGWWSHKPGGTDVTNKDSEGRPIWNPELAGRDYRTLPEDTLNYKYFCNYMCVPRKTKFVFKRGGKLNRKTYKHKSK
jgi:hypothetical protein